MSAQQTCLNLRRFRDSTRKRFSSCAKELGGHHKPYGTSGKSMRAESLSSRLGY